MAQVFHAHVKFILSHTIHNVSCGFVFVVVVVEVTVNHSVFLSSFLVNLSLVWMKATDLYIHFISCYFPECVCKQ